MKVVVRAPDLRLQLGEDFGIVNPQPPSLRLISVLKPVDSTQIINDARPIDNVEQ
jgi:hypothetical protein